MKKNPYLVEIPYFRSNIKEIGKRELEIRTMRGYNLFSEKLFRLNWLRHYISYTMTKLYTYIESLGEIKTKIVKVIDIFRPLQFRDFRPLQFRDLLDEIERSRSYILILNDNWDGEGGKGFEERTWRRATNSLSIIAQKFYEKYDLVIQTPLILPVADSSIDITWRSENIKLTINFHNDLNERPCFYGKDKEGNEIEGPLNVDKLDIIILPWLKRSHVMANREYP